MISVGEALDQLFALVAPLGTETVGLCHALDRVMVTDAVAQRDQPPFPASAMDGYAVMRAEPGLALTVVGESAAGHGFGGTLAPGQAVRIFTGAPVPKGASRVVIQEDVTRDGDTITLGRNLDISDHIRPAGNDFSAGFRMKAARRLTPNDIALLASMNIAAVTVTRRPVVALISTGDELVMPGEAPGPDQIIASNTFGLYAQMQQLGAEPRLLPIGRDTVASMTQALDLTHGADLIITVGGASVGDHDIVGRMAQELGLERCFYKVAMRPGKPLMAGRYGNAMMIGLPGNPVSAVVCGHVFVAPVVRAMLGLPAEAAPRQLARLAQDIGPNGPREHYMRAHLGPQGLQAFDRQDSSLLSVLGQANALLVRAPSDPARPVGDHMAYIPL
ncbi:molybdopterin molybdotransferase MoeA [Puniceibacterium sediminis]|uniref:Molybdopterin molybdenumtransferase n=1 Tax=Puniceibacterium sediminis TaxID=1608407 RepID=A0A238W5I1_9RHOB|nr:molybdopterin molybdotransferase MoeA [Puniceibacterium sediminis]SNR40959.1 molybdopterin molybdotransferase [Puniceibacterium sediminis]